VTTHANIDPFRARIQSAIAVFAVLAILANAPVELSAQSLLAMLTICCFVFAAYFGATYNFIRIFAVLLTVFTSTRYMLWRVQDTMPLNSPLDAVFGLTLFGAEIYGYVILLLSVFLCTDVMDRKPSIAPLTPERSPSVDVFIPTYNEDKELLEVTIRAALSMDYPASRLKVHVLDDGGTDQKCHDADPTKRAAALARRTELQALCADTGVFYRTRAKNNHAKAGNINAALPDTDGELILILDADHVPSREFLRRTVGYFVDDPKLFLVQTPHFFLNPDPVERNLGTFERMPGENEMFYSLIQRGLDSLNGSFFCGSAALLRRKCLEEVGGVMGDSITEDAETALELHARGYRSAYVARPMVAGLAPETFAGFIDQRMRWAQGMTQIMLLKNPLLKRGLSLSQRLCYLNSCFYWFFPMARLVFILAPLLYLLFGVRLVDADSDEFIVYGVPHVVGALVLSATLFGRVRWLFASELYELVQSVHCTAAILKVFRNPRAPQFVVTPKGEKLEKTFISKLAIPFYWLTGLVALGEIIGVIRLLETPAHAGMLGILLVWNTFHLALLFGALGVVYERTQRRSAPRLRRSVQIGFAALGRAYLARTLDVSANGLKFLASDVGPEIFTVGQALTLDTSQLGRRECTRLSVVVESVQHTEDGVCVGASFVKETNEQWRAALIFAYTSGEVWSEHQKSRSQSTSILNQIPFLLGQSFKNAAAHLRELSGGFWHAWGTRAAGASRLRVFGLRNSARASC
jgi:cellulose synthase (UDP-forming)